MNIYEHTGTTDIDPTWFKKDIWSHEEAACLINGTNPTPETLHFYFNSTYLIENANSAVVKTRDIFAATAWPDSTDKSIGDGKRPYEDYLWAAKSKGVRISKKFTDMHNHTLEPMPPIPAPSADATGAAAISPKMLNTLRPIIDMIDDFSLNEDFIERGIDMKRELIDQCGCI